MNILTSDKFYEIRDEASDLSDGKNHMGAIKKLNEAIKQYPSSGDLYACRAFIYMRMSDMLPIIQDATKALDLGLKYADNLEVDMYLYRGGAYITFGKYPEALSDAAKVINMSPKYSAGYQLRGEIYREMNPPQFYESIKDYDKAIELDPNDAYAYTGRGATWIKIDNIDKGKADLRKASSLGMELHPELKKVINQGSGGCGSIILFILSVSSWVCLEVFRILG